MDISKLPEWMDSLEGEDLTFIKKFILSSGSLKEMAKEYSVTYPTVRLRLDRLIQKIKLSEEKEDIAYIKLIKKLSLDGKIDIDTARLLISEYEKNDKEHR